MQVLVCDDDPVNLRLVTAMVTKLGLQPVSVNNGPEALLKLSSANPPRLAILDWEMPDLMGIEVCRKVRQNYHHLDIYLMLLTSRRSSADIVEGLEAGANDYITKPFDPSELTARVRIGMRTIELQDEIRMLSGLLPICAWCRKIRDNESQWIKVEQYVANHSHVQFTHGICPDCRSSIDKKPASAPK